MKLNDLEKRLVSAARKDVPSDHVPFSFEKRMMARLNESPQAEDSTSWVRALWWSAGACAAIALAVSVWSFVPANQDEVAGFSQDLEETILASAEDGEFNW